MEKSSYSTATLNFEDMTMQNHSGLMAIRRLSTPSYIQEPERALATKWIWYWEDDDGWKKYAEKKVTSLKKKKRTLELKKLLTSLRTIK